MYGFSRKGKEKQREEETQVSQTQTVTVQSPSQSQHDSNNNSPTLENVIQESERYQLNRRLNDDNRGIILLELDLPTNSTIRNERKNKIVEDNNGGEGSSKSDTNNNNQTQESSTSSITNSSANRNNSSNEEEKVSSEVDNIIISGVTFNNAEELENIIEENNVSPTAARELRTLLGLQVASEAAGRIRVALGLSITRTQEINSRLLLIVKDLGSVISSNGRRIFSYGVIVTAVTGVFFATSRTGNLPVGTVQAVAAVLNRGGQQAINQAAQQGGQIVSNTLTNNLFNNQTGLMGWFIGFVMRNGRYFRR